MALSVLITGANGFTGKALCSYLQAQGHTVRKASRSSGFTLNPKADYSSFLGGIDAVVHLAAKVHVLQARARHEAAFDIENLHATQALAHQAEAAGVKRFIFISTIGVHGNASAETLTELSPLRPAGAYAQSKWKAEQALAKMKNIETVTVRPPLIYGRGVKANFHRLLSAVARKKMLPFAAAHNKRDYLSLQNFCSAIAFCLDAENIAGNTFLLRDGTPYSTCDLITTLAAHMNMPARLLPVPLSLLRLGAQCLGKESLYHSICGTRLIDDSALRTLGWRPQQQADDALRESAQWFLEHQL